MPVYLLIITRIVYKSVASGDMKYGELPHGIYSL
jgi:hypothetical protein